MVFRGALYGFGSAPTPHAPRAPSLPGPRGAADRRRVPSALPAARGAGQGWAHHLHDAFGRPALVSLPEFMNFKLFGKTILVVNIKFGLFWAIHSASE